VNAPRIDLRPAVAADLPGLWDVRYAVTENTLARGRISDDELRRSIEDTGRGWVIDVDGRIQAFAIGIAATGNVWALFVHPSAQSRGYGTRVHAAMIDWFRTQPVDLLWLTTGTHTRARAFYDRQGWHCVGPGGDGEVRYERRNGERP
jgi:GNAT superfamily N-acetyltransferase